MLCFLPGAAEIARGVADIQARVGAGVEVVPLYGSLDADAQDRALQPSSRRRIVVATNIAETSLTVPGVTAVIDTGLHKIARYDAERGIDSLATERVTIDSADQRAGRAGRIAPGIARRLWDARDRLRPHREPDIRRIDLAGAALDVIAWGGDPRTFEWFEAPPREAIAAALDAPRTPRARCRRRPPHRCGRSGAPDAGAPAAGGGCSSPPAARERWRRRARCSPSGTCCRRARPRPPRTCCRQSIAGPTCRRECARRRPISIRPSNQQSAIGNQQSAAARLSSGEPFSQGIRTASRSAAPRARRRSGWRRAPARPSRAKAVFTTASFSLRSK